MVTKYSEDAPSVPRNLKAYSRTVPLLSNPMYCNTTASLTKIRHSEPVTIASVTLRSLVASVERNSRERQTQSHDGILMRLGARSIPKRRSAATCAFWMRCRQEKYQQTTIFGWVCCRNCSGLREFGRVSWPSWKSRV